MATKTNLRPIRNDLEHTTALKRIEKLFSSAPGTAGFDELEALSILVHAYETAHHPIDMPSPLAAIRFRMDQLGMKPKDLEPMIGSSGRVSEVLSGKRPLTLAMIRKLHRGLGIPADVLIRVSSDVYLA